MASDRSHGHHPLSKLIASGDALSTRTAKTLEMRARQTLGLLVAVIAIGAVATLGTGVAAADATGSGGPAASTGNVGAAESGPVVNVTVDSTPVSGGDSYRAGGDVTMTVAASVGGGESAGANVSEIVIRLDDEAYTTIETDGGNVTQAVELALDGGDNEVRVIVTDDAGNVDATQFTVRKDSDPPFVFLTSPYETDPWDPIRDGSASGSNVTLAGKIIEDTAVEKIIISHEFGDTRETYALRDVEQNFSLDLFLGYSGADERTNEFRMITEDTLGNVKTYEFAINLSDGAAPTVSFRPTPNATTQNTLSINGSVADDVWIQRANVTLRRPDGNRSSFNRFVGPRSYEIDPDRRTASFEDTLYLIEPGVHEATVSVTDIAGRTTTRTVTVERLADEEGTVAPNVTVDRDRTVVLGERTLFLSAVAFEGLTDRLVVETRESATGDTVDYRVVHSGERRSRVAFDREIAIAPVRTEVIVRATDPTGAEHTTSFVVNGTARETFVDEATPPDDTDPTNGSETGGENGTANGTDPAEQWPQIAVESLVDGRVGTTSASVSIRRAAANTTVAVPGGDRETITDPANVSLQELAVSVNAQTNLTATVTTRGRSAGALAGPPNATVAGTVTIQHSLSGANVSGATVDLRVGRVYLDDHGIDAANLSVYRLSDGNWSRLPTELVDRTAMFARYSADSPGLSVFALATNRTAADPSDPADNSTGERPGNGTVDGDQPLFPGNDSEWDPVIDPPGDGPAGNGTVDGPDNRTTGNGTTDNGTDPGTDNGTVNEPTGTPDIEVVETTLNRTAATINESVTVETLLRNTGNASGTYVAGLYAERAEGMSFAEKKEPRVPAGENVTVSFVTSFATAGNHSVMVNGTRAGPVVVSEGGGGGGGLLSVFSVLPLELIGMAVGGLVGLALVLVLVRFVLRRVGGSGADG